MPTALATVSEPRFYTATTTTWALRELAEERGLPFAEIDLGDFQRRRWPELSSPLFVVHAAHLKIARTTTDEIKGMWGADTRIVALGSDSAYYTRKIPDAHAGLLVDPRGFEYVRPEGVSLHLDLMNEVVDTYQARGFPADRWYWTASRRGLRIAEEVREEVERVGVPAGAAVVCYANPNVSAPGGYRQRLTRELAARGLGVQWGGTTEFVTTDEAVLRDIYRLYTRSRVCLGTSSPSWTPFRTMKGWRDWIAPVLGVPLIYDDIPEMFDGKGPVTGPPPVESFAYEDFDACGGLVRKYIEGPRSATVARQRDWAFANTIEEQFARVFDKYGLWE